MHSGGDDGFPTHLAFAAVEAGVVMTAYEDHMSSIKSIWDAATGRPASFAK